MDLPDQRKENRNTKKIFLLLLYEQNTFKKIEP